MPFAHIPQSPPTVLVTAYKKLLLKLHLDDPSYVGTSRLQGIADFQQARLKTELSLHRAFSKVETALVQSDVRALWQASAQRARDYGRRYWRSSQASTSGREDSTTSEPTTPPRAVVKGQHEDVTPEQLQHLFGQSGALRVGRCQEAGRSSLTIKVVICQFLVFCGQQPGLLPASPLLNLLLTQFPPLS
jgi:hypothetical protein